MNKEKERARLEEIKDRNKNESAVPLKEDLMEKMRTVTPKMLMFGRRKK